MKQSPLKRRTPLRSKSSGKRSQPRRDWSQARAKVEREGTCRLVSKGGCDGPLEAAHVIGREADRDTNYVVQPPRVVPLCRVHHAAYDRHEIDLLPVLRIGEQMWAVSDAGGIELARRRTAPLAYRSGV